MSNYHVTMKLGKTGLGQPHHDYISREGKYTKGRRYEDLIHKGSGNLPKWGENNSSKFWSTADTYEGINGRVYREIEFSLPNELSKKENIELTNNIIEKHIGYDYPYSYAIHSKVNDEGIKNIHCHLMFSERKIDGTERTQENYFKKSNRTNPERGGAKKDREWNKKDKLLEIRKSIADETNRFLERNDFLERVDHRSLQEQLSEAIKAGDIDKVELLEREPINLNGLTLLKCKEEQKLGKENLNLNLHNERIQKRKEKIEEYQRSFTSLEDRSNYEIRKQYDKVLSNLKSESIENKVLNNLTGGRYFKLINKQKEYYKEAKKYKDIYLKLDGAKIELEIEDIKEKYRNTQEYTNLYNTLHTSYTKRLNELTEVIEKKNIKINEDYKPINTNRKERNIPIPKLVFNSPEEANFKLLENKFKIIELEKKLEGNQLEYEAVNKLSDNKLRDIGLISNIINDKILIEDSFKDSIDIINTLNSSEEGRLLIEKEKTYIKKVTEENIEKLTKENEEIQKNYSKFDVNKYEELVVRNYFESKNNYKNALSIANSDKNFITHEELQNLDKKYLTILINAKKADLLEPKLELLEKEISKMNKSHVNIIKSNYKNHIKNQIEIYSKARENLKEIDEKELNKLAYNKISGGEYLKLIKKNENLLKEANRVNKELEKVSLFSFRKKKELKSNLKTLDIKLNDVNSKIFNIHNRKEDFKKSKDSITNSINNAIKKTSNIDFKNKFLLNSLESRSKYKKFSNIRDQKNFYSSNKFFRALNKKDNATPIRRGSILGREKDNEIDF